MNQIENELQQAIEYCAENISLYNEPLDNENNVLSNKNVIRLKHLKTILNAMTDKNSLPEIKEKYLDKLIYIIEQNIFRTLSETNTIAATKSEENKILELEWDNLKVLKSILHFSYKACL